MKFRNFNHQYFDENDGDGGDLGGAPAGGAPAAAAPAAAAPAPASAAAPAPAAPAGGKPAAGQAPDGGDWPADWRSKLSADAKHAKTLERFASPSAVFNSFLALRQKVDSGELRAVTQFPDKGTPEEQQAWRKANGIPEKPEEYSVHFGDGLVIGDADKPAVDDFLKAAHSRNMQPEQVKETLRWYFDFREKELDDLEKRDAEFLTQSEDALRAEWGPEYRTNVNMIRGLVDTIPQSIRDLFVGARLADGNALLNHPDMARWLVHTARTVNPVATVVPGAGANMASAIEDEITAIEKTMRTDRKAYNADLKMQQRLRELYDARDRAKR